MGSANILPCCSVFTLTLSYQEGEIVYLNSFSELGIWLDRMKLQFTNEWKNINWISCHKNLSLLGCFCQHPINFFLLNLSFKRSWRFFFVSLPFSHNFIHRSDISFDCFRQFQIARLTDISLLCSWLLWGSTFSAFMAKLSTSFDRRVPSLF